MKKIMVDQLPTPFAYIALFLSIITLLCKLSEEIFLRAAVHEKKVILGGTFACHTNFQGNNMPIVEERER